MLIGHFAPHLWAEGGIAAYVARLGAAQAARGHEVVYFSFDAPGTLAPAEGCIPVASDEDLFQRARDLDLDVLHLHKPVQSLPADRVTTVRTMHGNQGHCPSGSRYLARTGRGCERDVGLVACLWGHLIDHCGSRRPRQIQADFASIRLEHEQAAALRTSVVSSYLKRQMVRAGCPADRLHVLLSPAPDVPQAPAPLSRHGWPRFVFVGRLTPQKGADWLLRAAARVEDPIALDIAGEGPERAALEHLAQALGIAERTQFHGWISEADVQRLFAGARAVVVPSVWQE
ncbi:MAG: glycosyltransferase, partial [Bacteroidetes bacterium]|nr:glycosyltransferase [Bacteroidota bacterium]